MNIHVESMPWLEYCTCHLATDVDNAYMATEWPLMCLLSVCCTCSTEYMLEVLGTCTCMCVFINVVFVLMGRISSSGDK